MAGKPFLHIEIDEHSADAGAITRCEAFLDSIAAAESSPGHEDAATRRTGKPQPPRVYAQSIGAFFGAEETYCLYTGNVRPHFALKPHLNGAVCGPRFYLIRQNIGGHRQKIRLR